MGWIVAVLALAGQDVKVLHDFESEDELRAWEFKSRSAMLSPQHATRGKSSVRIAADEYLFWYRVVKDWSAYDALEFDAFVDAKGPVSGSVLIGDEAWKAKGSTYWNRHNGGFILQPGANTVSLPVRGLYRGEAGSRGNDLKGNIDPAAIARLDLGFKSSGGGGTIHLDQIRLVKESRPEGIVALDFGPASQPVAPGFTPVGFDTVHGRDGARAGLVRPRWAGTARDDGFPTRLYQDWLNVDGEELIVDLPEGPCQVWVVFGDLGYWGGEQARFRRRWIQSEGKEVWSETREPLDYLHRFERTEPKPGDSVWDLYLSPLVSPKRFAARSVGGKLRLRFGEDGVLGCRIAALVAWPDAIRSQGEAWIAEVEQRNRTEFERKAVALDPKAPPPPAAPAPIEYPPLEADLPPWVHGASPTPVAPRIGARGSRVSITFSAWPGSAPPPGEIQLSVTDLRGPSGVIPAARVEVRHVHHALQRTFNAIAYRIGPESLRLLEGSGLAWTPGLRRQFWLTIRVPDDAKAGVYTGTFTLQPGGLSGPVAVRVVDAVLDEPDFRMGFYGAHVPAGIPEAERPAAWRSLFRILREHGMNCLSGGPSIPFDGLDAAGAPKLDFRACDEYFRAAREEGFTGEVNAYGGPGMVSGLHDGYTIGSTGRDWEKRTGKPFPELLKIVWGAVRDHAKQAGWPPVALGMTDEPRVIEVVREQLELMKLYREHVPWVKIGGSYSVKWNEDPFEKGVQEIFKTLVWSALNEHGPADFEQARALGRELWIYNQGVDRFSFGAYQYGAWRRGVRGRMQWHTLALHGWQFFDLDGREPDTAMVNWGRGGLIPTLALARCREGADDFRFAATLWRLAQERKDAAATAFLEDALKKLPPGRRERPEGFGSDDAFRAACADHLERIGGRR